MTSDGNDELDLVIGGTWSVDKRFLRVRWSSTARRIYEAEPGSVPTLWELLALVDAADLPMLLARGLACIAEGRAFESGVRLWTPSGRKRVRIVGYRGDTNEAEPLLRGTISLLPGTAPLDRGPDPLTDLVTRVRDWEMVGHAIAHELRGPIATVSGFARALLEGESSMGESGRRRLSRILAATRNMDSLLEGLMKFSAVGSRPARREQVDLSRLATECFDLLRAAEPERQVQVQVEAGLAACGDPDLLRLVLANLLGNAWKFTRESRPARIAFQAQLGNGPAVFVVRDNGIGFEAHEADGIFAPFQRLHAQDAYEGSGLGLAIARRALERLGGTMWAEGRAGEGASFFFRL